jgi:hypothetical protein
MFLIENQTGVTIHYSIRWGKTRAWKDHTLKSGNTTTHSYPLGENRNAKIQPPYIHFTPVSGIPAAKEYKLEFHAVGYAGFGAREDITKPKRYYFEYTGSNHAIFDLHAR